MSSVQMIESNAGEIFHLFEVMKKYEVSCSLELNTGVSGDPLIGIASVQVDVEYFDNDSGPDALIVKLGEAEFSFDIGTNSFSKYVTGIQIMVCVSGENYTAWFNSGAVSAQGIESALCYTNTSD